MILVQWIQASLNELTYTKRTLDLMWTEKRTLCPVAAVSGEINPRFQWERTSTFERYAAFDSSFVRWFLIVVSGSGLLSPFALQS